MLGGHINVGSKDRRTKDSLSITVFQHRHLPVYYRFLERLAIAFRSFHFLLMSSRTCESTYTIVSRCSSILNYTSAKHSQLLPLVVAQSIQRSCVSRSRLHRHCGFGTSLVMRPVRFLESHSTDSLLIDYRFPQYTCHVRIMYQLHARRKKDVLSRTSPSFEHISVHQHESAETQHPV